MANKAMAAMDDLKNISALKGIIGGKEAKKELPVKKTDEGKKTELKEEKKPVKAEEKKEEKPVSKKEAKEPVKEAPKAPVQETSKSAVKEKKMIEVKETAAEPVLKKEKEQKTCYSAYFTDEEREMIAAAVFTRGTSISNYMRMLVLKDIEENAAKYEDGKELLAKIEQLKAQSSF